MKLELFRVDLLNFIIFKYFLNCKLHNLASTTMLNTTYLHNVIAVGWMNGEKSLPRFFSQEILVEEHDGDVRF